MFGSKEHENILLFGTSFLHGKNSGSMTKIALPNDAFIRNCMMAYSSYQGWLFLCNRFITKQPYLDEHTCNVYLNTFMSEVRLHCVHLYNPMSRVLVQLPMLPFCLRNLHCRIKFITSSSPTDPNCVVFVMWKRSYYNKSPVLAFCKLGETKRKWNVLGRPSSSYSFEDMIFYRGQFCTIDKDGVLFVYDNITNSSNTWPWWLWQWYHMEKEKVAEAIATTSLDRHFHLVKSKTGELLMVERGLELQTRRSMSFRVFKLNWSRKEWEEVVSGCEGDHHQALFLAWNDSMFVSIEEKELKPNCIHFFDESWSAKLLWMDHQVMETSNYEQNFGFGLSERWSARIISYGVYDLGNHTVEWFNPTSQITQQKPSFGGWFRPAAL